METKDKKEERELAPWQKELQKKFNKEADKKETLSQDAAKKFLGEGLVKSDNK